MSSHVRVFKRGIAGFAAICLGTSMMLVGTPAGAASAPVGRVAFPGSVPSFATAANDAGPADDTATVEGEIFLPLKDTIGAQAFATAVSTPGNAQYGKYLSPYAWISKYSPSVADFNAVKAYLVASGETIYATPASRQYIVFRGPASTTFPAFGTSLHSYRVSGKVVTAPSSAPTLPASIAKKVVGISLGNARAQFTTPSYVKQGSAPTSKPKTAATAKVTAKTAAAAALPACADYWNEFFQTVPVAYGQTQAPLIPCGYLPSQLRSSAGLNLAINQGYDGTGQTVAIVDAYASPTILADTNYYMQTVGSPILTKFSQLSPGTFQDEDLCQEPSGWQTEEAIDVQSAHSVAPGATILYSGGFNCGGGLDIAVSKVLDGHLANIISNSYGGAEPYYTDAQIIGETDIATQAVGEGIGLYYSSGDGGDNTDAFSFPSSSFVSSFATSVGGTSEGIDGRGKTVLSVGWGDTLDPYLNGAYELPLPGEFIGGAGGGPSSVEAQPAYQKGVVPSSLSIADGQKVRVQPDIADLADPETGFQIAISPIIDDTTLATGPLEFDTYGGTSLASPLAAAKIALVQQLTGKTIGFSNPLLYKAAIYHSTGVTDVKPLAKPQIAYEHGSVSGNDYVFVFDQDNSLHTANGYDDVTGVGTLNVSALASFTKQLLK